jgi:hypothetical protein
MDLDSFMIAVWWWLEETLPQVPRWPAPILSASAAPTMEVVGAYQGLSQNRVLCASFQRRYARLPAPERGAPPSGAKPPTGDRGACGGGRRCPTRCPTIRTGRSATACRCLPASAPSCRRFRGVAAAGTEPLSKPTCAGFRRHARLATRADAARRGWGPSRRSCSRADPAAGDAGHCSGRLARLAAARRRN